MQRDDNKMLVKKDEEKKYEALGNQRPRSNTRSQWCCHRFAAVHLQISQPKTWVKRVASILPKPLHSTTAARLPTLARMALVRDSSALVLITPTGCRCTVHVDGDDVHTLNTLGPSPPGIQGVTQLCEALTQNDFLQTLILETNSIGDDGARVLAAFMEGTPLAVC